MSEQEAISLCQKGKLEHFTVIYDTYFDKIYKFVFLKTYDKELAQDITSETFLKALDKINTFKNNRESSFNAWIYRIAYNLIIDDYKVANRTINIDEVLERSYDLDFAGDLDNKEKIKEVFRFFDTLNPKHKQILIMRIWDDLSFKEISELTGESVDNCKKIVSRTLSKITGEYLGLLFILLLI
ncbi:sigma-70 family RNA polymerase sigma factor [Candidatus Gracilibacteria bacterium]|nr:sigma-70 family RNA polymerase sigma factor [Candidatus Gracilibacteria bacterium]